MKKIMLASLIVFSSYSYASSDYENCMNDENLKDKVNTIISNSIEQAVENKTLTKEASKDFIESNNVLSEYCLKVSK